ncbi:hypothetical protein [Planktothrix prolifica]|uniref:hypothetical protein n=1 Tax=Planktothrix prolifica TaxID=54307 RepID=UPI00041BF44F|nr:hypothetical protein [Planktothrix prolifica]
MLENKLSPESFMDQKNPIFPESENWKNTTVDLKIWHEKQKINLLFLPIVLNS